VLLFFPPNTLILYVILLLQVSVKPRKSSERMSGLKTEILPRYFPSLYVDSDRSTELFELTSLLNGSSTNQRNYPVQQVWPT
jgi:hypothetical protein